MSLQAATMLDTMVMIWVRISLRDGKGVGVRMPDKICFRWRENRFSLGFEVGLGIIVRNH